jgi:Na+-transporting NADH:ubiquinone oxidoreductase subunit NqrD
MSTRALAISLAACLGLTVITAWLLDWSLEKAIILAPIIVVVAGAAGFLVVLWAKVIRESVRARRQG